MAFVQKVKERVERARERRPLLDHVVRTVQHYGEVDGSTLAGAVTYFGFLSVFPILLLAFAAVGAVSGAFPEARDTLIEAIDQVLPGMVGPRGIDLTDVEEAAGSIALIGLVTVLYSGLGWLRGMQTALRRAFVVDERHQRNVVVSYAFDLVALVLIGVVLLLSVAVSGVLTRLSRPILEALELGVAVQPVVVGVSLLIGLLANAVLFWVLFRLLAAPDVPARSLWSGALLGAVGFEVLKQLSTLLLASTAKQPAAQAFGIALVLLVWINYFSRVVLYAASWSYTSRAARERRSQYEDAAARVEGPALDLAAAARVIEGPGTGAYAPGRRARDEQMEPAAAAAVGAGAMLALVALLRRLGPR